MFTLEDDRLEALFPAIGTTPRRRRRSPPGARGTLFERPMEDAAPPKLSITFERTLRVPCDDGEYPLPPSLGAFPLRYVDDYADRVPRKWLERGGILLPMYQSEAMWINFHCDLWGFAVQIAAGKINAVSGEPWHSQLCADPQGYCVVPTQPWLDGFKVTEGTVRQFVAAPLGEGHTVEEQVAGSDDTGGVQIAVCPMRADAYWRSDLPGRQRITRLAVHNEVVLERLECAFSPMGLAAGGSIRQEIAEDEYGVDAWDQRAKARCFVHLVNSQQWRQITGERPPHRPPSVEEYNGAGLPWFEYYDESATPLPGSTQLRKVRPYNG